MFGLQQGFATGEMGFRGQVCKAANWDRACLKRVIQPALPAGSCPLRAITGREQLQQTAGGACAPRQKKAT
jgi:hypothetical protein